MWKTCQWKDRNAAALCYGNKHFLIKTKTNIVLFDFLSFISVQILTDLFKYWIFAKDKLRMPCELFGIEDKIKNLVQLQIQYSDFCCNNLFCSGLFCMLLK